MQQVHLNKIILLFYRLLQLKKINNPPREDQEMSKRFKKFIEIKQAASAIGKNNKNSISKSNT